MFFYYVLSFMLAGFSTVRNYHHKAEKSAYPIVPFSCEMKHRVITDSIVEVTAQNIKDCYPTNEKLLWIRFWVPYCGDNSYEVALAEKYKDQVDLVWVAILWDYSLVRQQMKDNPYPIFYIDRKLPKHRSRAANEFLNQIINNDLSRTCGSDVFISNGQLVYDCYSHNDVDSVIADLLQHP